MYDLIIRRGLNKKKVTVCIILLILLVTLATISGIRFAEHHEVKKQAKLSKTTLIENKFDSKVVISTSKKYSIENTITKWENLLTQ